jgi:lipopolysaccharide export LptBFGC system permease protein LptF
MLLGGIIVLDLSFKIGQFFSKMETSDPAFILNYYALRVPLFLFYVLPSSILLSAMFTYYRMAKSNELVPLVVSGTDLRKFSLPFVGISLFGGVLMGLLEEFVLPGGTAERSRTEAIVFSSPLAWHVIANDHSGNLLKGTSYDRVKLEIKNVVVGLVEKKGFLKEYISAERATWNESKKVWELHKAFVEEYEANKRKTKQLDDGRIVPVDRYEEIYSINTDIRPQDIEKRQLLNEQFMSVGENLEKIKNYPREPFFKMLLYSRMSSPLAPLILIMGGLPFVVRINPRNFFIGVGLCTIVVALYYLVTIVFYILGNRDVLKPAVATVVPCGTMLLLALLNYFRMKT